VESAIIVVGALIVDHVFVYLKIPLIIPSANMIECVPSVEAVIIVVDAQSSPAVIAI
jgi:hypothetical protein